MRYSQSLNGGFCLACSLFKHTVKGKLDRTKNLISQPVFASNDTLKSLRNHDTPNGVHSVCFQKFCALISQSKNETQPIDILLDTVRKRNISQNRRTLVPIVDTIKFCGRLGLPLRGHRDSSSYHPEVCQYSTENNVGVFVELLNLRVRSGDEVLENHLKTCPKNATYISKTTQNELIKCCAKVITDKIISEIKVNRFFFHHC